MDDIEKTKAKISEAIKEGISTKMLSIRILADKVDMAHPQIARVTGGKNYHIETLLKILHGLDLELQVVKKKKK